MQMGSVWIAQRAARCELCKMQTTLIELFTRFLYHLYVHICMPRFLCCLASCVIVIVMCQCVCVCVMIIWLVAQLLNCWPGFIKLLSCINKRIDSSTQLQNNSQVVCVHVCVSVLVCVFFLFACKSAVSRIESHNRFWPKWHLNEVKELAKSF